MQMVNKLINKMLESSCYYQEKKSKFANNSICICVKDTINFNIDFTDDCVIIDNVLNQDSQLLLTGSKSDFIKLMLANDYYNLSNYKIEIKGNVELAQHFSKLIDGLSPDWHVFFNGIIGPSATDLVLSSAGVLKGASSKLFNILNEQLKEYIVYEKAVLVTKPELEEFCDAVDTLRLDAEILLEKAQRLGVDI